MDFILLLNVSVYFKKRKYNMSSTWKCDNSNIINLKKNLAAGVTLLKVQMNGQVRKFVF